MFIALRFGGLTVAPEEPAEGRELSLVVEEEDSEDVVTVHVCSDVIPIVLSWGRVQ